MSTGLHCISPSLNRNINSYRTFHAPSFGDDEFEIAPLALPPLSPQQNFAPLTQQNGTFPYSYPPQYAVPPIVVPTHNLLSHHIVSPVSSSIDLLCHPDINPFVSSSVLPKFPPQNFEIPNIDLSMSDIMDRQSNEGADCAANCDKYPKVAPLVLRLPHHQMPSQQMPAVVADFHQLQAGADQLEAALNQGISPPGSNSTSPSRVGSSEEFSSDDSVPLSTLVEKRVAAMGASLPSTEVRSKKLKAPKKRKKKDPNEPQKPISAYALFFRDTQAAIKGQNPSASFGEVSKIVASMWDSLDEEHKNTYKKKTELAKKEYLKKLAAYRANLVSKGALVSQEASEKPASTQSVAAGVRVSYGGVAPQSHPTTMAPHMVEAASPIVMNAHQMSPPQYHHHHQMSPQSSPTTMNMSPSGAEYPYENQVMPSASMSPLYGVGSPGMCVRSGCHNMATENPGWDREYCSSECVVNHCRDVFTAWVAARQNDPPYVK